MQLNDPALFDQIARHHSHHSREDDWWVSEDSVLDSQRGALYRELEATGGVVLGPLGFLSFSYVEMGAINSLDLFGLDELILFSFYWQNRHRYRNVVDMGANIGLHSVLLGRMGLSVAAYEPDPRHAKLLQAHIAANDVGSRVSLCQAAVAPTAGPLEFVRVLGNTTGSHVAGAKRDPYGELEVFEVQGVGLADAILNKDLGKMDVEGLEADLLTTLDSDDFAGLDIVCEVGNRENAAAIWDHFARTEVHVFAQKIGWRRVSDLDQMPTGHREGSIFLSRSAAMNWGVEGS